MYEYYNLQKQSPTVGCFMMADDYIKFLRNLQDYLNVPLTFIHPSETKWREWPEVSGDKRFGSYPIGKLTLKNESIEIFFLHYRSEAEAREKWVRRCKRVNWSRMLVKFNDQNGCISDHITEFFSLPYRNKVFFTCKKWDFDTNIIRIKQFPRYDSITASHEPFGKSKYINIDNLINSI